MPRIPDPVELSRALTGIAERGRKLRPRNSFPARPTSRTAPASPISLNIGGAFLEMTTRMMADPAKLMQAQMKLWTDYMELWQRSTQRWLGADTQPLVAPGEGDRRFKDAAWDDNAVFDYIKQSYLLSARWLQSVVREVEGLDDKTATKVDFYTRQFVDAMAPSNFVLTNPEVLRATIDSGGENLVKGLEHLLEDLEHGKGRLDIKMTDLDAFEVGR